MSDAEQLKEANKLINSIESVLVYITKHSEKIPDAEDGTPFWYILDGCLSGICMYKNPPKKLPAPMKACAHGWNPVACPYCA